MELRNGTLYLKRTYIVKKRDRIIDCQVTVAPGVPIAFDVEAGLINGKDYEVSGNTIVSLSVLPDKEPEGLVYQ